MGEVIELDAIWRGPKLQIMRSGDGFNKSRGTFFYHDAGGDYHGPFMSHGSAQLDLMHQNCDPKIPMRTSFEQGGVWWWKKDMPTGPEIAGPYASLFESNRAINQYNQELKDKASDQYR